MAESILERRKSQRNTGSAKPDYTTDPFNLVSCSSSGQCLMLQRHLLPPPLIHLAHCSMLHLGMGSEEFPADPIRWRMTFDQSKYFINSNPATVLVLMTIFLRQCIPYEEAFLPVGFEHIMLPFNLTKCLFVLILHNNKTVWFSPGICRWEV